MKKQKIIDGRHLLNQKLEEAKNAMAELIKPTPSLMRYEAAEESLEDFEAEMEDEETEDELDPDAIEEMEAVVKRYLKEKEEAIDDYESGEIDAPFAPEDEEEFSDEINDICERYGITDDKMESVLAEMIQENLADQWKYPTFNTIIEQGRLDEIQVAGTDDELIDLTELSETSQTGADDGPNGYRAFKKKKFEDMSLGESIDRVLEMEDELELEPEDDDFDLDDVLDELVAETDGEITFDDEDEDDDEELDLEAIVNGLEDEAEFDDDDDDLEVDIDADLDSDEELEMIGSQYEDEYQDDTEDEDEDENTEELDEIRTSAMQDILKSAPRHKDEVKNLNFRGQFRDYKKEAFASMQLVYTGDPRLLTEQEDLARKVVDKYGKKAILRENKFADICRKRAGINVQKEMDNADGTTLARRMAEEQDNPFHGMKMKRDSDKGLIIEN